MKSAERDDAVKRGYLKGDFEFFHLKDRKSLKFDLHYHDFNKVIIFISGSVTYHIEGRAYRLKPWDILFISSKEVHRPVVELSSDYERIVLWMNHDFLEKHNSPDCDLSTCFESAASAGRNLLRLNPQLQEGLRNLLGQLEEACKSREFGSRILRNSLFLQMLIQLNRMYLDTENTNESIEIIYDETVSQIIEYINGNLDGDLSVDALASCFYRNKYYLMHRFKQQTGYTLHSYILNKRIMRASMLIKKGAQAYEACSSCGFGDYSSFVRAFKKVFDVSPKQYQKKCYEYSRNINKTHRGDYLD